jgi:hypothetical protein
MLCNEPPRREYHKVSSSSARLHSRQEERRGEVIREYRTGLVSIISICSFEREGCAEEKGSRKSLTRWISMLRRTEM